MFKRILIAAAALGLSAMAVAPTAAFADTAPPAHYRGGGYYPTYPAPTYPPPYYGGGGYWHPHWGFSITVNPPPPTPTYWNCGPAYRTVKWWDQWGNPHWSNVPVDQNCAPPPPHWGRSEFPGPTAPW